MQQLNGLDSLFLHGELDGLPQHIGCLNIYDQSTAEGGIVRFKQILAMLESRLHESPIFRRKLAFVPGNLGRPYWTEDPDFDLEHHVHHIALPKPGDWRQLYIQAARIQAQPLRLDRPLWEMHIIEGLSNLEGIPSNCFALLLKIHHSAMDGATGALFMDITHDDSPKVRVPDKPPERVIERPSKIKMLGKAYLDILKAPAEVIGVLKQGVPAFKRIRQGKERQDFHPLDDKQVTRFQGKISHHRVVERCKFDFDTVRAIKNTEPGATINDAILTIVSGALRKYLKSKGELPKQQLVSSCPIDVRDESDASGGNMIGAMTVGLRTDLEDPAKCLAGIHQESVSAKAYAQALGPRIPANIAEILPNGITSLAAKAALSAGLTESKAAMNTVVSNVPGPAYQQYMCGAELVDGFGIGQLLPPVGLFHIVNSAVQNKKGTITISFTSCRTMMPDPEFYTQCLQESFDELKEATLGTSSSQPAPKKVKAKVKPLV